MRSSDPDAASIPEVVLRLLAGAVFAADFSAVKVLLSPKSKLRLALDRGVPSLIEREAARVLFDPEVLGEADREEYERIARTLRERHGDEIRAAPFQPHTGPIEEIAERAIARGSFASASSALDELGTLNKRVGDLISSGLADLKSAESASSSGDSEAGRDPALRSAAQSIWTAVRLKNPLEPLFQKLAVDLHFANPKLKEKLLGALLAGNHREAIEFCVEYLVGDRETTDAVCRVLTRGSTRRGFLRELAQLFSGGEERYAEFVSRYRQSADALRETGSRPNLPEIQKVLGGEGAESVDGIVLVRRLAVVHPVSSLVCRVIPVPREGAYLIPTVVEGRSALDILDIAKEQ